jgi:hypothetical protein
MQVEKIAIDKHKARELYQAYKTHQHYQTDLDREIARTYRLIAEGKVIIQAIESVKQSGLDAKGLPKLALGRADLAEIYFSGDKRTGSAMMCSDFSRRLWRNPRASSSRIEFRAGSFEFPRDVHNARARLPIIPVHLRPKRALEAYHVLWEAEWEPVPPRDPYLLRRVGKGDLWLVCAAWDLTDVERAAMATRIVGN